MQESKTLHYILGISLVMIAVFVVASLVMINSQAVDNSQANTTVSVTGQDPTLVSLYASTAANSGSTIVTTNDASMASGGITLVPGDAKNIYLNGAVTDANGTADIVSVDVRFFANSASNLTSAFNPGAYNDASSASNCVNTDGNEGVGKNYCFYSATCTLATSDSVTTSFSCPIVLPYYTTGTAAGAKFAYGSTTFDGYKASVVVHGSGSSGVTLLAGTFTTSNTADAGSAQDPSSRTINTSLSLAIPSATINYGSIANNAVSTAGQPMVVAQNGNDLASAYVYSPTTGGALTCSTTGSIAGNMQKFTLVNEGYAGAGNSALPDEAISTSTTSGLDIGYQAVAATLITDTLYWNVSVPYGVAGTCTGLVNVVTYAL